MKITEFRLGEIPFLAIDRLLDFKVYDPDTGRRVALFDDGYLPTEYWKEEAEKKTRTPSEIATAVVYWYPTYIDHLYRMALPETWKDSGPRPSSWDNFLQVQEAYWFRKLFKETAHRLDKIENGKLKLNHVEEILIKNGRVKL